MKVTKPVLPEQDYPALNGPPPRRPTSNAPPTTDRNGNDAYAARRGSTEPDRDAAPRAGAGGYDAPRRSSDYRRNDNYDRPPRDADDRHYDAPARRDFDAPPQRREGFGFGNRGRGDYNDSRGGDGGYGRREGHDNRGGDYDGDRDDGYVEFLPILNARERREKKEEGEGK